MLRRHTGQDKTRILDKAEPAIEGWIAQQDTTSSAIGLQLGEGGPNKRAADASALVSRGYREGA
ncbi:hypothetical protein GCM10007320_65400 [Pseudorhodoferax aquiterrae]|uniref:Uncharacterized protein n=1 Tax=Pseudorhodoferax aquiterrae TaxID=747304 RepID=A0ABQ3GHA6_9BURK|nr:hypothetical protein GCM10007320_65400 [Pseudorhodoferax aquiterrae]